MTDLRFGLSVFLRRLPWFAVYVVIGSALGLTLAVVLPPVYVAQARLLLESEQIPDDLAASTVRTEATEQLEIIQQRILTRDTLLDIADRLDVHADDAGRMLRARDPDAIAADMRERIAISTTGGGVTRGNATATLVGVSFTAADPVLAATVTQDLVTRILQADVAMRTGAARQTLDFFARDVARLDADLAAGASAILAFQQANTGALPDSLDFRRSRQAAAQERLLQLDREAAALRDRSVTLSGLRDAAAARGDPGAAGRLSPDRQRLRDLREELSGLRAVLSPENPRIRLLESRIAALAAAQGDAADDVQPGPYDVQLAEVAAQLSFVADQRAQVNADLAALNAAIDATPGNASALETLQRDHANLRRQYDQAVANLARARTGDAIETLSRGQRITVIEPAIVPSRADWPNRPLIAATGVIGGIVAGLAMVILLEALNRGIRRPADLSRTLGIATFATLPYIRTRTEVWRRRAIVWGVLAGCLAGIPLTLWALDTYYMPLDLLIERLARATPAPLTAA